MVLSRLLSSTRAASDNITHGTWILATVALGALALAAFGFPQSPVHVWLECNILEIPNIRAQRAGPLICQVPLSTSAHAPNVTSVLSSTGNTITSSTVLTVIGTHLPLYTNSSPGALASTTTGGETFPNLLVQMGSDDTAVGNPQSESAYVQFGNDSASLGNSATSDGVTVLTTSSTVLQFRPDVGSAQLTGPWDLWVTTGPIALGTLASAGDNTTSPTSPAAGTPVSGALLDQWSPPNTATTVPYGTFPLSANTVITSEAGGGEQDPTFGFSLSGGETSSLDPAARAGLSFGQSPNWAYDYVVTHNYVVGGPMTFSPGDESVYPQNDYNEYPSGYIFSGTLPTTWNQITMTAVATVGTPTSAGNPTLDITGTFSAVTPAYTLGAVAGSGGPEMFGGRTIPIIFAPVDVTVDNQTGQVVASGTLVETVGSLNGTITLPAGTSGAIIVTLQTPSADDIQGVGIDRTQVLAIPSA